MRLRDRKVLVIGTAAAIVVAAVAVGPLMAQGPAAQSPGATPRLPPATAAVTRAALFDTRTLTGTLGYGEAGQVGGATGTLTWLAPEGSTVERGEALFAVDGRPVVALYGSVPLYRTLRAGATQAGPSVEVEAAAAEVRETEMSLALERERLEEAEARRGEAAARQTDSARDEPRTPEFVGLRRTLRAADRRLEMARDLHRIGDATALDVQEAEDQLAVAVANLEAAILDAPRQLRAREIELSSAQLAVVRLERHAAEARERLEGLEAEATAFDGADVRQLQENLIELGYGGFDVDGRYDAATADAVRAWQTDLGLPATGIVRPGDVVFTPGPVRVAAHAGRVGDRLAGGPVLSYTGSDRLVMVDLRVVDQGLAALGRSVTVTIPGVGAVEGVISRIGTVVRNDEIEVTVTLDQERLGSLDAAPVEVAFVSEERPDVLSVPVAALLALAEGGFGVEVVEGASTRIIAVRTGMFASGRVEVVGDGLVEGMRVGVPR
jgi:peptidoglycan hydrolase-like protein with peptidoglycan-binding domain